MFAAAAAIAVLLAIQVPRAADYEREEYKARLRAMTARIEKARAIMAQKGEQAGQAAVREEIEEYSADYMASFTAPPSLKKTVDRFTAVTPTQYFTPLIAMAICFVPVAILVLARIECLGSFSMLLQRDYAALLVCALFSWTSAYLLLLVVNRSLWALHNPAYNHPALWWTAQAYFLILTAFAIRMIFRVRLTSAMAGAGGAWAGAIGGIWLYAAIGNPIAYVASPCLMYYLYCGLAPGVRSLGGGFGARQRLKEGLQNATMNPCDADAHYQLGLIYSERRQHESAIECFRKAVEVAPNEPEAHYQLGRIAREQGRYREALEHCRTAARLDDKLSSSEVWREIGIAGFLDGDTEAACQAFEKYLERRPYDPEALCWYGRTLAKLNRVDDARGAFEQAIESVRTMPPGRKRQLRSWESESSRELKKLPAAHAVGA